MQQQVVGGGTPSVGGGQPGGGGPQHQQRAVAAATGGGGGIVRPSVALDAGTNSRPPLRSPGAAMTDGAGAGLGQSQLPRQQQILQHQQISQQHQQQQISQQQQQISQQQQQQQHIPQQQQLPQSSLAGPPSSQQMSPGPDLRLPQPPSPGGASLPQPLAAPSAAGRGGATGTGGQPPAPRTQQQQHLQHQSDLVSRNGGSCRAGPGPGIAGGGTPSTRFMRPPPPPATGSSPGSGGMPLVAVSSAPQTVLMPRPPPPPPPPPPVLCSRPPPPFPHPPSLLHHHHPHHHHHHQGPPPPPPHHLQQRLMDSQLPSPFYDDDDDFGAMQRGGRRSHGTLRITKWVNPIPFDPDDGQQQVGEQELATKMLQIQSKRFYIDVKQNRRGRFMKVAEIGADGRRNQVFLALSTAAEFREHLTQFSDFYSNLGPPNPDTLPEDGKLKSETMVKDNRRYYLDLKENSRGRFLRVSQTIARGGPRCQIAIPAQGMIEFRDALQELLDEFGTDDGGFKGELPEGRHMRVENKNFYFDIGQNNRGIYMRISEVKTNFRTAITIPEKSWSRFRDIFTDYVDKMKEGGEKEKAAPPSGESSESSPNK